MDLKRVLVTGADGFIGSHLTETLLEKGYKVKALSQYNSFNFWGWLEDIPPNKRLEVISGDIRDPHFCKKITKDVDLIFHLAALIAIPFSYVAPDSYVDTNVKGTLNICQAAKENGRIRLIHTSTSEVYGTARYVPIDEKHPKQPQSPYSASKIGADAMAMSFYNAFELPVTIARPFNTYGPRQSARGIIPTIITQILSGVKEIKLGNLTPTRDMNFVKDTCTGIISLAECKESIGKEVNIASNYEISMHKILELIKNIMSSNVKFITEEERVRAEDSEVYRLWGDNSLITKLTGFKQKYSFEEGLKITCEWFSDPEILKKYKPDIYNI
ncbi:dTDP-glucose 4,6-dehydratase [subsurface metagenome]